MERQRRKWEVNRCTLPVSGWANGETEIPRKQESTPNERINNKKNVNRTWNWILRWRDGGASMRSKQLFPCAQERKHPSYKLHFCGDTVICCHRHECKRKCNFFVYARRIDLPTCDDMPNAKTHTHVRAFFFRHLNWWRSVWYGESPLRTTVWEPMRLPMKLQHLNSI